MKYQTCIHSRRRENSRSVKESCPKARAEKKGLRIPDAGLCESCKSYRRVGNLFAHPCDTGAKCPCCGIGFQPLDQEGKDYQASHTKRGDDIYAHTKCLYSKEDT